MRELLVISGKGGTGKTTITAGLAATGPAKVIADCDVDAADLHLIAHPEHTDVHPFFSGQRPVVDKQLCTSCGICHEKCHYNAIDADIEIRAERCEGCAMCAYVCPTGAVRMIDRRCGDWFHSRTRFGTMIHAALGIGEENSGKLVTTVRQASGDTAQAEGRDVILTDGPPGIGCPVIASLTNTSMALLVTEPTLSAIHDLKRVLALCNHFRVPAAVLLNKADVHCALAEDVRTLCETSTVPLLDEFGWTEDFTQAQLQGLSVVEYRPAVWTPRFETLWESLLTHM